MKTILFAIGLLVLLHSSTAHAQVRSRIGAEQTVSGVPVAQYSARVTVPDFPPIDGQIVSDWIGLTVFSPANASGQDYSLLQPVLNFGANDTATGRGNYWSITPELNTGHFDASGNITSNNSRFGLTYVVNPGEHIDMLIIRLGPGHFPATQSIWRVQMQDEEHPAELTWMDFTITDPPATYTERIEYEQEFVQATRCEDTPSVLFDQMRFFDRNGAPVPSAFNLGTFTDSLPSVPCGSSPTTSYGTAVEPSSFKVSLLQPLFCTSTFPNCFTPTSFSNQFAIIEH